MSPLRIALQGRDTCNGTCESASGCECLQPKATEQQLDQRIAERRAFANQAEEAIEHRAYCSGWRWGLIDGVLVGGLLTVGAFVLGQHWLGA